MITIGLPSYGNPSEVWFTVQALRLYQDLEGVEVLVADNQGNDETAKVCRDCKIRYERFTDVTGTGPVRNAIFRLATMPFVLVIDSHVLLWPEAMKTLKWWLVQHWNEAKNLIQGPMVLSALRNCYTHYENKWRAQMWGTWPPAVTPESLDGKDPFEIEMMGCGLFGCRKDSWLGFHSDCRGFDGVEGVIHAKYRKAGRKVLCLPFLRWVHLFRPKGQTVPYPIRVEDRIHNFILGFREIGLDLKPVYEHFGYENVRAIEQAIDARGVSPSPIPAGAGSGDAGRGAARDDLRGTAGNLPVGAGPAGAGIAAAGDGDGEAHGESSE
jgi:glycosyltransferase involved in cell wall biosynthesis